MRFLPGTDIPLYGDHGTRILARPFYYSPKGTAGLVADLYAPDGRRFQCLDELEGVFKFNEDSELFYLKPCCNGN